MSVDSMDIKVGDSSGIDEKWTDDIWTDGNGTEGGRLEWKTAPLWGHRRYIDGRFRFCAVQNYDGMRRHYICGQHQYCCALGCCLSTAFSFYQLWYFWLLVLLILLLCSGGGWWFRWRHGNFGTRSSTPTHGGRRRHGRNHGSRTPRVYPHSYYTSGNANACNLPPGYDKDPPSYNEVISHLSQFPRPEPRLIGGANPAAGPNIRVEGGHDNQLLSVPPPSYQAVVDLKRKESQLDREIAEEERVERVKSTRSKIQNLLGRSRRKRTPEDPFPPPVGSFPSTSSSSPSASSSSSSSVSSGLFTISRESLNSPEYYVRASNPSNNNNTHPSAPLMLHRSIPSPSDSGSSSHSDYSSSFISSPSSVSRSTSTSPPPIPPQSPPRYTPTAPPLPNASRPNTSHTLEGAARTEDHLEIDRGGASRPCTGRSVLSRPTTSISARSLPPPPELQRKTSLPGALAESDGEENDHQ